ncbi:MAG: hypothetical protein WCP85_10150 [Mariniphaga sp.]
MGDKKIKPIVYLITFIVLTIFYGFFWEIAIARIDNIYAIKTEIIIPIAMAFISTIGFYLTVKYNK